MSAEVKEEVFKLDIISCSFFHLPYDREMRNWYILLPLARNTRKNPNQSKLLNFSFHYRQCPTPLVNFITTFLTPPKLFLEECFSFGTSACFSAEVSVL